MKKLVEEVDNEGMAKLMGQRVTFFCVNYIYTGKLTGINEHEVLLTDAGIVYETGELSSKEWTDHQNLPNDLYIRLSAVESYMVLK